MDRTHEGLERITIHEAFGRALLLIGALMVRLKTQDITISYEELEHFADKGRVELDEVRDGWRCEIITDLPSPHFTN